MLHWTFTIPEVIKERERERGEDKSTIVYGSTKRWQN
jgi:predicted nucleotidyltransferase